MTVIKHTKHFSDIHNERKNDVPCFVGKNVYIIKPKYMTFVIIYLVNAGGF